MRAQRILFEVRYHGWVIYLICLLLTIAVYWPALQGEFIMDDWGYITQNADVVQAPSPLKYWTTFSTTDYWPLTYTLYWLEFRLFGQNPLGYHLVNVFIHSLNGFLIFLLAIRLKIRWPLAASLLFLLHPLHVQATAWIAQSKTLLATLFVLVTILQFHAKKPKFALAAFALSLLTKTSSVFLPFVLLFWEKSKPTRAALRHFPFFALAIGGGLVTLFVNSIHFKDTGFPIFQMPWYERLQFVPQNLVFYLNKFVMPYPLSYLYPPAGPEVWGWMIFWLGCFCWLRHRFIASYLLLLAPALGFVTIPNMKLSLVADHWAYLPNVFLCLFAAEVLGRVSNENWIRVGLAGVLSIFSLLSTSHARTFATEIGFWQKAVAVHSDSAPAAYNLAVAFDKKSRMAEATAEYKRTVALDPNHARAWNNLARAHFLAGNLADAKSAFESAIGAEKTMIVAYLGLAKVHTLLLDKEEAKAVLVRGLLSNPQNPQLLDAIEKGL